MYNENGRMVKRVKPNEAYCLCSTIEEDHKKGRKGRLDKLGVTMNNLQDIGCISNKDMLTVQAGHFSPSIGFRLLTGDVASEMLKFERKVRMEIK